MRILISQLFLYSLIQLPYVIPSHLYQIATYGLSLFVRHILLLSRQTIYLPPFLPRHPLNYSFLLKEWKSSVESIRTKLHTSFSKYMEKLQYKGEIQLRMKDTFMDWGTSQQLPPPCLCLSLCSCLYLCHFLFLCSCLRL